MNHSNNPLTLSVHWSSLPFGVNVLIFLISFPSSFLVFTIFFIDVICLDWSHGLSQTVNSYDTLVCYCE